MKRFISIKAFAIILTAGCFGLAGSAQAHDHDDPGDVFLGIIGEVVSGAIEAKEARERDREFDRYCRRLDRKCDWGERWACRKYYRHCDY